MSSASRLREWRYKKNLTIEQLSKDIDKKPVTVRAYESARGVEPQLSSLRIWSEKYGLDIHWYATGVGDMDYNFRMESEKKHQMFDEQIEDLKNRLDFWVRAFEESSQKNEKEMGALLSKYDYAMRLLRGQENEQPAQVYKAKQKKGDTK